MNKILQLILTLTIIVNFYGCSIDSQNNNKTESASNMISSSQSVQLHRRQWWLEDLKKLTIANNKAKQVKIAIVDDGVKKQIPELTGKTYKYLNAENIKGIGNKHASGIATIIAGKSTNSKQVQGITDNSIIVSIDISDDEEGIISNKALIRGLELAINEKPDILNLSLGTNKHNRKIKRLVSEAQDQGIIVVASAGNYMENDLLYPAKYDGVIAVGAIDKNNEILSPKGTLSKPVIYLPGKNVVTAIGKNKYIGAYGSSFSTAIATGMIASSLENACLSKDEIRQKLNSTQTNVVGINDFATLLNMRNQ